MLCVQTGGAGSAARSTWREEGHGADLSAVSKALIALLLGYLDAALPSNQQHSGQAAAAAEEDMQVCFPVFRLCTDSTVLCCSSQWLFGVACCCAALVYLKLHRCIMSQALLSNTDKQIQSDIYLLNKSSVRHTPSCFWSRCRMCPNDSMFAGCWCSRDSY